jgi:hypothetical protein
LYFTTGPATKHVEFWYSDDTDFNIDMDDKIFTQIGTTVSSVSGGSGIFSPATDFGIGFAESAAGTIPFRGQVYRFQSWAGDFLTGTLEAELDPTHDGFVSPLADEVLSNTGETWTLACTGSGEKLVPVAFGNWQLGVDDYFEVATDDKIEVGLGSFTMGCGFRKCDFAATQMIIGNRNGLTSSDPGWSLHLDSAGSIHAQVCDGTTVTEIVSSEVLTDPDFVVTGLKRDGGLGTLSILVNGNLESIADTTGDISSGLPMRIGATAGATPALFNDMDFYGSVFWCAPISDAEIEAAIGFVDALLEILFGGV